jgi:hypothetical protein
MANEITLHGADFVHLKERSVYNHNYYQHRETGEIILEDCDELYGEYTFYRCLEGKYEIFLGRGVNDLTEETIVIHPDWA